MNNELETQEKDQLYTALAQAQQEFPVIQPNRKAYKNEYADLYGLLRPIYPILSKYGLSIRPWAGKIDGEQWIGARLMHKSGQFETNIYKFESDPCKNPNDQPSHKKQAAITYFNRNHMKDMLGILITEDPDDDDGQTHLHQPVHHRVETITQEQLHEIYRIIGEDKDLLKSALAYFNITEMIMLPKDRYSFALDTLIKKKAILKSKDPENIIHV